MNPFLKPQITIPFLKNYLFDPNRIEKLNEKKLQNYRDKVFRKILSYAYTIPVYHQKYKQAGIHPKDIKGLKDIHKLPFITRKDFRKHFPDGIIPNDFDKGNGQIICTGGTTTKYCCQSGSEPVCTYTDYSTMLRSILLTMREYQYFNINWRKTKFAHIGNFNSYKFDEVFEKNIINNLKPFFSFKNQLNIQASKHTDKIIQKLTSYNPDIIISYPSIFQDLAYAKRNGLGKKIRPKLLFVGGAMLDEYTRKYVQHAFNCKMLNQYASCEAGANIAFECHQGSWHIHSDFFHLEAIDNNMEPVAPGERGQLVLTRLYGTGTPMIRYTGMNDWITLSNGRKCSCGLTSPIFKKPVEGRITSNIILPNGRIFPPSQFLDVASVLVNLDTFKIKKFQIVQRKIDEINILLVIDDKLRNTKPHLNEISEKITKSYKMKVGAEVTINVKETDELLTDPQSGKPDPLLISHVENNCKIR